jgi:hypothetical protein
MPVEPGQGMSNDIEAAMQQLSPRHSLMKAPALHSLLRKNGGCPFGNAS